MNMDKKYGRFQLYGIQILYYIVSGILFLAWLCVEIGILVLSLTPVAWAITGLVTWFFFILDAIVGGMVNQRVHDLRDKEKREAESKWKQDLLKFKSAGR